MSNCLIAYDNLLYDGATFAGPTNVARLGTTNYSERVQNTNGMTVTCTLTVNGPVALAALYNHNMGLSATVRLRGSNDAFATTAYDSGTLAAYPSGSTAASIKGLRATWWHKLSSATTCTTWKLDITDTGNTTAIGRLMLAGSVWQPTINMQAGASLGWEGGAQVDTALNGGEWFTEREPFRVARFRIKTPMSEMLASGFDLSRVGAGARREVLFVYDPADTVHQLRRTVFGRLRQLGMLEDIEVLAGSQSFEVKELL